VNVQLFYDTIKASIERSNWEEIAKLQWDTNQQFCDARDVAGLRDFYAQLIAISLDDMKQYALNETKIDVFQAEIALCLSRVKAVLPTLPDAKGVYFEYFFDGGDASTGNFFICDEYSDEDDYWGAEFSKQGFIEGPKILKYFQFDADPEWDSLSRLVGSSYADGMLLSACIAEWINSDIKSVPLGFANHDSSMVRLR